MANTEMVVGPDQAPEPAARAQALRLEPHSNRYGHANGPLDGIFGNARSPTRERQSQTRQYTQTCRYRGMSERRRTIRRTTADAPDRTRIMARSSCLAGRCRFPRSGRPPPGIPHSGTATKNVSPRPQRCQSDFHSRGLPEPEAARSRGSRTGRRPAGKLALPLSSGNPDPLHRLSGSLGTHPSPIRHPLRSPIRHPLRW